MSQFRFSINLVQVRELTLYTLWRLTPYIVILVLAREREFICFEILN